MAEQGSSSAIKLPVADKTLGTTANLVKLLPGGTVLTFQALAPSFSNYGDCHTSNKILTSTLLVLLTFSCFFFTFTDSFTKDGKLYFGIATWKGFYIFNSDEKSNSFILSKYRIRIMDFLHAIFSCLVFLAFSFGDAGIQRCFIPGSDANGKQLLVNLPLGIGFMSSVVFLIFPTSRKGIGYSENNEASSSIELVVQPSNNESVPLV